MNDRNKENKPKKILIAYASQYGSTAEVAQAIGKALQEEGCLTKTEWVAQIDKIDEYDAIIIGSAIQFDKWMPEATDFVLQHQDQLSKLPVAYFFTCLTLSRSNEKTERQASGYADKLLALSPTVKPVSIGRFAGTLNFSKMSIFRRTLFRSFSLVTGIKEGDYRDWDAIHSWAKHTQTNLLDQHTESLLSA